MINMLSIDNVSDYGWLYPQIFACRYRSFVERQSYLSYKLNECMEHDEYDTPATVYFAWLDEQDEVRATARLNPTDRPYMLRDKFPQMVEREALPASSQILEGSRICIDKDLPAEQRQQAKDELVLAYIEYGLWMGAHTIIGMMQNVIVRRVYAAAGCPVEYMGDSHVLDGQRCTAVKMALSPAMLRNVQKTTGIAYPAIQNMFNTQRLAA